MSTTGISTNGFTGGLHELETSLETPVIPGEFEGWAKRVHTAAVKVLDLYREMIIPKHAKVYEEMEEADPELIPRIGQLREKQQRLIESAETFVTHASQTIHKADRCERGQDSVTEALEQVTDKGLELVIELRKHMIAVKTWFNEAALRDRGVQD